MGSYRHSSCMNLTGKDADPHQGNSLGGEKEGSTCSGGGQVGKARTVFFLWVVGGAPEAKM